MMNTILLAIIVLFLVFYAIKALTPVTKKSYFKAKLKTLTRQMWELEFKIDKTLQVREGIRQDRDKILDAQHKIEAALKANPTDEALLKEKAMIDDNILRYERQMKMLDDEIHGVQATSVEEPGKEGINDTLATLAELKKMTEQYINYL